MDRLTSLKKWFKSPENDESLTITMIIVAAFTTIAICSIDQSLFSVIEADHCEKIWLGTTLILLSFVTRVLSANLEDELLPSKCQQERWKQLIFSCGSSVYVIKFTNYL